MENIRIKQLEKQLNIILDELDNSKKETKFDKLLIEYKKVKKEIYLIEQKIKSSSDKEKVFELQQKQKKLNENKTEILKKFKLVEIKEKKLFSFKNRIDYVIKSNDSKLNYLLVQIKRNSFQLEDIDKLLNSKFKKKIEKEIIDLDKIITSLEKEIELKKSKKQIFIIEKNQLIKNRKNLRDNKNELNKIKNSNKSLLEERKNKLLEKNKILNEKADVLKKEIDYLLKMIDVIAKGLSFIEDDEISDNTSFIVKNLNVWYGSKQALFDINLELGKNEVIAIIGPSGCGKSTFLRTLNRINDNIPSFKAKGKILFDGEYDIFKLVSIRNRYDKIELSTLRTKVGMIFQQPNPFPMTIAKNVQYGPKVRGIKNKSILNELTEKSLKQAGLWDEVKDNLKALGTSLSGGQQQRLCIARAIANQPEVLLMDEPTSALDPIAAKKIEDLILKLKEQYTVIMVTHSMQQAQRISDKTAFFYQGNLIEYGTTKQVFEKPKQKETKEYISGKFG